MLKQIISERLFQDCFTFVFENYRFLVSLVRLRCQMK